MNALIHYRGADSASETSSGSEGAVPLAISGRVVDTAPPVDTTGLQLRNGAAEAAVAPAYAPAATARTLAYNAPLGELYGGGLADVDAVAAALRNTAAGTVEDAALPTPVFDMQFNAFNVQKAAEAPDGRPFRGAGSGAAPAVEGPVAKRPRTEAERAAATAARDAKTARRAAAAAAVDPDAPWRLKAAQPWAAHEAEANALTEEQQAHMEALRSEREAKRGTARPVEQAPTSVWSGGKQGGDWADRGWLAPPKRAYRPPEQCFLPKRWVHTWGAGGSGHTKGVNCIRFFPKSGHLLLSAGLDSTVKLWDVAGSKRCMRTYLGHSAGVRMVTFNADGSRFVSAAYDKRLHLWDTETGQVIRTLDPGPTFYCATLHPSPGQEAVLLAGASDKKIYQFDLDSGEIVQTYTHQLAPVNTITFLEDGETFVATGDDKIIRLFALGIDVPTKIIQGESMHSLPAVAVHPGGKGLCYTSLDSKVVTYATAGGRFRLNPRKEFRGHLVGGNAIGIDFSPDGKFLASGDAQGRLFFWEWRHPNRVARSLPAHEKAPCVSVAWHPTEPSKVATCGWDGLIKYWD